MRRVIDVLSVVGALAIMCGVANAQSNSLVQVKQKFIERYGFFMSKAEKNELDKCLTENCITIFEAEFFSGSKEKNKPSRDPNPGTAENEFKELIDSRISDIEGEIFFQDSETLGLNFKSNGGLRGELAHVYLLYGMPHFKARLPANHLHVELMVWYYFDPSGKPLFRFLFYNKFGSGHRLFKNYLHMITLEYLTDPLISPLKDISDAPMPTPQDLYNLWMSLAYQEDSGAFVAALLEFSYYNDINIGDALRAPEPAAITAQRYKPRIIGEPPDLSKRNMMLGSYRSFIPSFFRIIKTKEGMPFFGLVIPHATADWEIKDGKAESRLLLRVTILNKKTLESHEFSSIITLSINNLDDIKTTKATPVALNDLPGSYAGMKNVKLKDIIDKLERGDYRIDIDFMDVRTTKTGIAVADFTK